MLARASWGFPEAISAHAFDDQFGNVPMWPAGRRLLFSELLGPRLKGEAGSFRFQRRCLFVGMFSHRYWGFRAVISKQTNLLSRHVRGLFRG
jgi:hypothetical protein